MLVTVPGLELFFKVTHFLISLQSGELFAKVQNRWGQTGISCWKMLFEVDALMVLLDHAVRKFKAEVTQEDMDQTPLMNLSTPPKPQVLSLPFIPDIVTYISYDQVMTLVTRRNYLKDQMQAGTTHTTEHTNTTR